MPQGRALQGPRQVEPLPAASIGAVLQGQGQSSYPLPTSFSKAPPSKGSTAFSNTVTSCKPTVQTCKALESMEHLNHSKPQNKGSFTHTCLLTRTRRAITLKIQWGGRSPPREDLGQRRRQLNECCLIEGVGAAVALKKPLHHTFKPCQL